MFKMKHPLGKENIRCERLTPQTIKPTPHSPIQVPISPYQHTFAKAKHIKKPTSNPNMQALYLPSPSQDIDLECDENLQAFEGGTVLRQMAKQIQNELMCDEELQQPCSKCSHYEGLISRVRLVLEAYHKRTSQLERELRIREGEKELGDWDRQKYYRQ